MYKYTFRKTIESLSYIDVCLILISFHMFDMLSTDIVLYHGSGNAVETNVIASSTHGRFSVIFFRCFSIALIALALYLAKLDELKFSNLIRYSWYKIASGKLNDFKFFIRFKIWTLVICFIVSFARLCAALSNLSGEYIGVSIPIFVETCLKINSIRHIGVVSSVFTSFMAVLIVSVAWEFVRKKKIAML